MNILDGVAAAYMALATVRGSRRGVADEGYRLFRLAVSFVAGCGLFTLLDQVLDRLLASTLGDAGGLGFAGGLALVFIAMRKLRSGIMALLQRTLADRFNRPGGAVAGLLRAGTAVTALLMFLQVTPWLPGHAAAGKSLAGKFAGLLLPAEQATQERAHE